MVRKAKNDRIYDILRLETRKTLYRQPLFNSESRGILDMNVPIFLHNNSGGLRIINIF